jgi:hypothetical protein
MDQAPEGQAGPAPGRGGAGSSGAGSSEAARAAAAAAAIQAICRTQCGGQLLDEVVRASEAAGPIIGVPNPTPNPTAQLRRIVSAGCDSAPSDDDTATVLAAVMPLVITPTGPARIAAAGLLAHAVQLMRSRDPEVVLGAVSLCQCAATMDASARDAVAREPGAVPALLELLCRTPAPWDAFGAEVPASAAKLLGLLALPTGAPSAAAAAAAGGTGGAVAGSAVTAAVLAAGGVERIVALLPAALGDGGNRLKIVSVRSLLSGLNAFVATHPGAVAAARAAGALPLAARAVVAAQPALRFAKAALLEGLGCIPVLAADDDLPALAARPDLVRALAGAVAAAADGANPSDGWSEFSAEGLGQRASVLVAQLLAGGQESTDAATEGFVAAGGAAHLVRCRARASVGGLQCGVHACGSGTTAAMDCTHARSLAPTPFNLFSLTPNHRTGEAPVQLQPMQPIV